MSWAIAIATRGAGRWSPATALAAMLRVPDTMELFDYREGEPHSKWRRRRLIAWPNLAWLTILVVLFAVVFAWLNQFTEL